MHAVSSFVDITMHSVFLPEIFNFIIEVECNDKEFLYAWLLVIKQYRATVLCCYFQEIHLKTYLSSLSLAIIQWYNYHEDSVLFVRRVIIQGTFAVYHIIFNGLFHTDVSAILCTFPKCNVAALVDTIWILSHLSKIMISRCQELVELECRDVEFFPTLNSEIILGIWPSLRHMSVIYQGLNTLFLSVSAIKSLFALAQKSTHSDNAREIHENAEHTIRYLKDNQRQFCMMSSWAYDLKLIADERVRKTDGDLKASLSVKYAEHILCLFSSLWTLQYIRCRSVCTSFKTSPLNFLQ